MAGGLAGIAEQNTSIYACSFEGIVKGRKEVGGLIGRHNGKKVVNSYSKGSVYGYVRAKVGGLSGNTLSVAEILDCYSESHVHGPYYIGGLVGFFHHDSKIIRSYSTGAVNTTGSGGGLVGS